jgi:hypothetical protein
MSENTAVEATNENAAAAEEEAKSKIVPLISAFLPANTPVAFATAGEEHDKFTIMLDKTEGKLGIEGSPKVKLSILARWLEGAANSTPQVASAIAKVFGPALRKYNELLYDAGFVDGKYNETALGQAISNGPTPHERVTATTLRDQNEEINKTVGRLTLIVQLLATPDFDIDLTNEQLTTVGIAAKISPDRFPAEIENVLTQVKTMQIGLFSTLMRNSMQIRTMVQLAAKKKADKEKKEKAHKTTAPTPDVAPVA